MMYSCWRLLKSWRLLINVFTFRRYKIQCECYNSLQLNIHCEVMMWIECYIGKTTLHKLLIYYYKFMLFLCSVPTLFNMILYVFLNVLKTLPHGLNPTLRFTCNFVRWPQRSTVKTAYGNLTYFLSFQNILYQTGRISF